MITSTSPLANEDLRRLSDLRLTFVGLGLMGGSLALALRPYVARIVAVDVHEPTRLLARQKGVVDEAYDDLARGVHDTDLIVVATPVRTIIDVMEKLPSVRSEDCMLMDLGSTKRQVITAMDLLPAHFQAIGLHPMCGREHTGLTSAAADLYRRQNVVVCRSRRTLRRLRRWLWRLSGLQAPSHYSWKPHTMTISLGLRATFRTCFRPS